MCNNCKGLAPDETCEECPVNNSKSYAKEELCEKCFNKKLVKREARKQLDSLGKL